MSFQTLSGHICCLFVTPAVVAHAGSPPPPDPFDYDAFDIAWIIQPGTRSNDECAAMVVDDRGDSYLTGWTSGSFVTHQPLRDVFLLKHDAAGNRLWTVQVGSDGNDWGDAIALSRAGDVYVAGWTSGDLAGQHAGSSADAFLLKFNPQGVTIWSNQLGTEGVDAFSSVCVDAAGDIYAVGNSDGELGGSGIGRHDIVVFKFDPDGNVLWSKQFGSRFDDIGTAVALDHAGSIFVAGSTNGDLSGFPVGGVDIFLSKLDPNGDVAWIRQYGSIGDDEAYDLAIDQAGDAYICGWGNPFGPNGGNRDGFLAKIDGAGNTVWSSQLSTPDRDGISGLALGDDGMVYFTGSSGPQGAGNVIVGSMTETGESVFLQDFGTPEYDEGVDLGFDDLGYLYVGGVTNGDLHSTNAGMTDLFLARLEQTTCYADCDGSLALDVFDFLCFQDAFVAGDPFADCDGNTTLDVFDFLCFQDAFTIGCP
jgi:hypothetical protein